MEKDQKELFSSRDIDGAVGKKLLELLESGIHTEYGFKAFCHDIDKEKTHVRDALNGKNKFFSITWLSVAISRCPRMTQAFINLLCDIASPRLTYPEPRKEMTVEEELAELREFKKRTEENLESLSTK